MTFCATSVLMLHKHLNDIHWTGPELGSEQKCIQVGRDGIITYTVLNQRENISIPYPRPARPRVWYGNTFQRVEDSIMIPSLPTYIGMLHTILLQNNYKISRIQIPHSSRNKILHILFTFQLFYLAFFQNPFWLHSDSSSRRPRIFLIAFGVLNQLPSSSCLPTEKVNYPHPLFFGWRKNYTLNNSTIPT